MNAYLILQDKTIYRGQALGATGTTVGEVVFNTSMTGYQEISTDPSYCGQLVTFTYPLQGNYGTNFEDVEAPHPFLHGVIINELEQNPSNFREQQSLDDYLKEQNVIGIAKLDTRALTLKIREHGVLPGAIVSNEQELSPEQLRKIYQQIDAFTDHHVIPQVSCSEITVYQPNDSDPFPQKTQVTSKPDQRFKLVAFDFGMKANIPRQLHDTGFDITIVPFDTPVEKIRELHPDAIFLSNGPGDPKSIPQSIASIAELTKDYPLMGICLGQQILALALGADTYKLKFGHRGANHPVKNLATNKVFMTSQNHGYSVDPESLAGTGLTVSQINLNDGTLEGLKHETLPIFSVQYHPEASPGPLDSRHLFQEFYQLVKNNHQFHPESKLNWSE